MNDKQNPTTNLQESTPVQTTEQTIPIEVKWHLPEWMLRDPGLRMPVEDDDIDFQ